VDVGGRPVRHESDVQLVRSLVSHSVNAGRRDTYEYRAGRGERPAVPDDHGHPTIPGPSRSVLHVSLTASRPLTVRAANPFV
jgi:hypothetical protein